MAQHSSRRFRITGQVRVHRLCSLVGLTLVALALAGLACKGKHQPAAVGGHQADSLPQPHQGSWSDTRLVHGPGFTLLVPTVAVAELHARDSVFWITDLPACRYFCAIEIEVRPNPSRAPLGTFVARVRATDSATNDPDVTAYQPGPASVVQLADQQGLLVQGNCGDCTGASIFVSRGSEVARIAYSIDDRE